MLTQSLDRLLLCDCIEHFTARIDYNQELYIQNNYILQIIVFDLKIEAE